MSNDALDSVEHPTEDPPAHWPTTWWTIYRMKWAGHSDTEVGAALGHKRRWVQGEIAKIRADSGDDWIPDAAAKRAIYRGVNPTGFHRAEAERQRRIEQARKSGNATVARRSARRRADAASEMAWLADQVSIAVGRRIEILLSSPEEIESLTVAEMRALVQIAAKAYETSDRLSPIDASGESSSAALDRLVAGGTDRTTKILESVEIIRETLIATREIEVATTPAATLEDGVIEVGASETNAAAEP